MRVLRGAAMVVAMVLLLALAGCTAGEAKAPVQYLVGVSLANMREPWRLMLVKELREEAEKHPGLRLVFADATQDADKQIRDIDRLLSYGIDLLIISPSDVDRMTPEIGRVYNNGIPVIVLDRAVEGYDYSLFIGPDNQQIGRQAGEAVIRLAGGSDCKVLELRGNPDSPVSQERIKGFHSMVDERANIGTSSIVEAGETRDGVEDLLKVHRDTLEKTDIIFAHNDYMALGAYRALQKMGISDVKIVGIDGFTGEDGGIDLVRQGTIDQTITCPTGGKEVVQFALDILNENSGVPKQVILRSHRLSRNNLDSYLAMLDHPYSPPDKVVRVGYAQVGTESGWRLANNNSIKQAARDFGIDLIAVDADQSQARQIEAVRRFIEEAVDVIVISPVVNTGWDEVLEEARKAGIPVLLSDRKIEVENPDLYKTFIGADFIEEGRRAAKWMEENVILHKDGTPVRILEIEGTIGATPTIERQMGFRTLLDERSGYEIVHAQSGDFTLEGGAAAVTDYLVSHKWDIEVIFAHNDDMALGAARALEQNGIRPGVDVKIISVDGTREAVQALVEGRLNCVVECSPLLGPQLMKAITDLMSGQEPPLRIITDEVVFTQPNAKEALPGRTY